jgi:hypothetical protein
MNDYQKEQLETLQMVRKNLKHARLDDLRDAISAYLEFRQETGQFYKVFLEPVCEKNCFDTNISACCTKDGIIVFFGDVVINALVSLPGELDTLEKTIATPADAARCIFLSQNGCSWKIKPIVCEMFVCHPARQKVFARNPEAEKQWKQLEKLRKTFTWPDQPVLFEHLENRFMGMGQTSSLMHFHKSPGLLRIRQNRSN